MSTPKATELAPVVVARIARRVSAQHRRAGWVMKISAGVGAVLSVATLIGTMDAGLGLVSALLLVGSPLYVYTRRRAGWQAADRIAEAASTRSDLAWTHYQGRIHAHDRTGPRPALALAASPQQRDIDEALPVARLVSRSALPPAPDDGAS